MEMYRQGDVLLVRVDEIPDGTPIPLEQSQIVLAYGEVTGHRHTIDVVPGVEIKWIEANGERYLESSEEMIVSHQEHAAIALPKGAYRVIHQREYTPETIRPVSD